MKIVTVVGARPQFVKAAAVNRAIQAFNRRLTGRGQPGTKRWIKEVLVHTGQHYDYLMDGVFFEELGLPRPQYHLGVGSASHGKQTAMMLERIEGVLRKEKPDVVVTYGDTNSTLAGALASVKLTIPLAHVEAGLRSYNRAMPEESNRVLTDHVSTFLFCPSLQAIQNLEKEGLGDGGGTMVKNVGDVMYDSILHYSKLAEKRSAILGNLGLLSTHPLRLTNYYLATFHRAENTDNPEKLGSILRAFCKIGASSAVILPLHPRARKMLTVHRLLEKSRGIHLLDPVPYFDMVKLMKHAKAILTDSGGVQKEAYWLEVPCITLREETEWPETVRSGWNVLGGTDAKKILEEVDHLGEKRLDKRKKAWYGDGDASRKIVHVLSQHLS